MSSTRSLPATRHRLTGSLTTTASGGVGAAVARTRVGDAVLHDGGRPAPAVPGHRVERRDVDDRHVAQPGVPEGRMLTTHGVLGRRVVLQVQRGQVGSQPAAGPALDEVDLVRPLEDDDVDLRVVQLLRSHLPGARRPVPGLRPAAAVRAAVGKDGQEVVVLALDERGEV